MLSKNVGIRDAKVHLSKLIKMVKNGDEIILTDRGRPVGKIVAIEKSLLPLSERLKALEERGIIEAGSEKEQIKLPQPIPLPDEMAQRYLQEDRNNG